MAINIPYQPTMLDYVSQLGSMYLERQNQKEQSAREANHWKNQLKIARVNNASAKEIAELQANMDQAIAKMNVSVQEREIDSNENIATSGYQNQAQMHKNYLQTQRDLQQEQGAQEVEHWKNQLNIAETNNASAKEIAQLQANMNQSIAQMNNETNRYGVNAEKDVAIDNQKVQRYGIDAEKDMAREGYSHESQMQQDHLQAQKDLQQLQRAHEQAMQNGQYEHAEKLQSKILEYQKYSDKLRNIRSY